MAMMVEGHEFYTTDEACAVLDVKPATLYAYVSRNLLHSYREGLKRRRLYRRSEVEDLRRLRRSGLPSGGDAPASTLPSAESWIPYT